MAEEVEKKKSEQDEFFRVGFSHDVYEELLKLKVKKERDLGISLSWSKFFVLHLKDFKEATK